MGKTIEEVLVNKMPEGSKTGLEPIAERVPIERKIDLHFTNFEGLVTGVSANLSTSGMFIQSNSPEAAGTEFIFALRIEEWSPIQGTAKVIWIRPQSEGPERPAGMGVKFVDLDAQSRRMIRWLVDKHLQDGGKPFDLDTVPAGASKYAGRAKQQRSIAPVSSGKKTKQGRNASSSRRFNWLLGSLVLVVLAAAAYGIYWKWFQDQPGLGGLRRPFSVKTRGPGPPAGTETLESTAETASAEATAAAAVTIDEVAGFIQSWSDAWEARDLAGVLAHYADDFDAAAYGGRGQWESGLRQQLERSEHIRVAVSALEISFPQADLARATFFRSFRSNVSDESGRLLLELEPTDEGWRIHTERQLD